ncbi:hypothetical protein [Clostridium autoethanogenum]|uniref:hypothetical protein n=1 Tax=Clostridium autoethanogenum TaxID=84023 RepID=UPI0016051F3A|nr:hypothetical protein [Clostridium autoethanogenum]
MANPAFTTLMDSLNAQIQALNKTSFKLYDEDNRECFINKVKYDGDDDKLICEFEEEN